MPVCGLSILINYCFFSFSERILLKTGALIVLGDTNVSRFMGVGDTGVVSGLRLKLDCIEFVVFLRPFFTLKEGILSLDLGETSL